jgi:hypothetical protein
MCINVNVDFFKDAWRNGLRVNDQFSLYLSRKNGPHSKTDLTKGILFIFTEYILGSDCSLASFFV